MYVYLKPTTTAQPSPRIAMESVVIFDPWPFNDHSVKLAKEDHYWLDFEGRLHERDSFGGTVSASAIFKNNGADFLARATDGKLVIGTIGSLRKYEERVVTL